MAYWNLTYKGKTYAFDPNRDLTLRTLRHIKGWYGRELGTFTAFNSALGEGDPDALACVIWICRTKAGETNVRPPQEMEDFAIVDDFYREFEFVPDAEDPTTADESAQDLIGDTEPTLTNSGENTPPQ